MNEKAKTGELFSRQYLHVDRPLPDSPRARVRLAQYYSNWLHKDYGDKIQKAIPAELGVELPYFANFGYDVSGFLKKAEARDFLSAVTLIYRQVIEWTFDSEKGAFIKSPVDYVAGSWQEFVSRVFKEESLAFTVDEECGVHPLVDMEYERNIASSIACLGMPRFGAARSAFEAAQAKLASNPPDTKGALRDIFEAAETLTKLISGSGKALTAGFVRSELEPQIRKHYEKEPVAGRASGHAALSFADWIDAVHQYRHGHQAEEPIAPPTELAVLLASQGASYIRWLVDMDRELTLHG